jgi:nitroreductase
MQPLEVYIVLNKKLDELREKINVAAKEKNRNFGAPFTEEVPGKYLDRRKKLMDELKRYLIEDGMKLSYILNGSLSFFNAPAAAFIYIHKSLYPARAIDIGSYMVYFMQAAESLGLGSCPIGYIRGVSDVINEFIGIPYELILQIAIAFGYKDSERAINKFRSSRIHLKANTFILE